MLIYISAIPEHLNAMTATELRDLYNTKRDEIYKGLGKCGMWDFPEAERKERIIELERLAVFCSRKLVGSSNRRVD